MLKMAPPIVRMIQYSDLVLEGERFINGRQQGLTFTGWGVEFEHLTPTAQKQETTKDVKEWRVYIRSTPHPGFQSPPGLWTIFSRESL